MMKSSKRSCKRDQWLKIRCTKAELERARARVELRSGGEIGLSAAVRDVFAAPINVQAAVAFEELRRLDKLLLRYTKNEREQASELWSTHVADYETICEEDAPGLLDKARLLAAKVMVHIEVRKISTGMDSSDMLYMSLGSLRVLRNSPLNRVQCESAGSSPTESPQ